MKKKIILLTIGLLIFALNSVQANIAGHWEGKLIGDDDQPIRVTLDLGKNAKLEWTASMGLPEENMTGLVVQDVTVEGKTVKFVAVELMMTPFDLTLGPEGILKGTISGSGAQAVEFKRTGEAKVELISASPAVSEQLEGVWEGMLQTPRCGVPMTFHFKNQPDNTVMATFSTERDKDLPLNDVKQTGQKVEFGMKIAHSRFEGTLNPEGTELAGQVIHGDGEHFSPMTLRKKQTAITEYKSHSLIGTWEMVSFKHGSAKEFSKCPPNLRRIKMITETHSIWFEFNADTQETKFGTGGSYTIAGNTYTEAIVFWSKDMKPFAGKKHTFTVKIDGDEYTQSGQLSSGFPIEEVWRRIK